MRRNHYYFTYTYTCSKFDIFPCRPTPYTHETDKPMMILHTLLNGVCWVACFHLTLLFQCLTKYLCKCARTKSSEKLSPHIWWNRKVFAWLLLWLFPQDCRSTLCVLCKYSLSVVHCQADWILSFRFIHTQHAHMNAIRTQKTISNKNERRKTKDNEWKTSTTKIRTFLHDGFFFLLFQAVVSFALIRTITNETHKYIWEKLDSCGFGSEIIFRIWILLSIAWQDKPHVRTLLTRAHTHTQQKTLVNILHVLWHSATKMFCFNLNCCHH